MYDLQIIILGRRKISDMLPKTSEVLFFLSKAARLITYLDICVVLGEI